MVWMSIGIYKITNKINNKSYIGQSIHIERRWSEHLQGSRHNPHSVLHLAMKKYGEENFIFEILELCDEKDLNVKEEKYIIQYNTLVPMGYNVQKGGDNHSLTIPENIKALQQDLLNTDIIFEKLADKYNLSTRTITRVNQGDVWFNNQYSYPLRSRYIHVDGWKCVDCGKTISQGSLRCVDCANIYQRRAERPPKEQLALEVIELGFEGVGYKYGVTGNAIKKWCVSYGLPKLKKDLINWVKNNL